MIMKKRYAMLRAVKSTPGDVDRIARQPVPLEMRAADGENSEYFRWLHSECANVRQGFIWQMSAALRTFNAAKWPRDLKLPDDQFPYKMWQGKKKPSSDEVFVGDNVKLKRDVSTVNVGEVRVKARANRRASTQQAPLEHCFVTAVYGDAVEVQPSGMRKNERLDRRTASPELNL